MIENNKRAIIYCRVSSEDQATNGLSIDVQEKVCRECAEKDGNIVIEVVKDEGKSGKSLSGRTGMKRILNLARNKEFDVFYAIHGDRLARNTEEHLMMMRLFKENAIEVKFLYQAGIDRNTASGYMADTMNAVVSEYHSKITSEKTMSALREKAKEGWSPAMIPIGYMGVENPLFRQGEMSRHVIVPDPDRASLITEMFSLYATDNYNGIDLNEIVYKKGLRTKRGARVSLSITYQILQNPFYAGEMHWHDIHLKEGKQKPLVDRFTFDRVQQVLAAHNQYANRKRKYWFLLRGLVKCAEHRSNRYTAEWHTKKSGLKFAYYHCSNQSGCPGGAVEIDTLESEVGALFRNLRFSETFIETIVSKAKLKFDGQAKEHDGRTHTLSSQKKRLLARRKISEEKLFKGVLTDDDFTRIRQEIAQELSDIDGEIRQLESRRETTVDVTQEVLRLARDVYDAYKKAPPVLKQQYHRIFFKEIFASKKQLTEVVYSELFDEMLKLRVLTREKPTENKDTVILRAKLGASRESDPYRFCHREELYH